MVVLAQAAVKAWTSITGGVNALFKKMPDVAGPAAFIAAVLAVVGLTTETLGVATRTASIWISVLVALLSALLLLGTVARAEGIWATTGASAASVVLVLLILTLVWAANAPSRPSLAVAYDRQEATVDLTAGTTNLGNWESLSVRVYWAPLRCTPVTRDAPRAIYTGEVGPSATGDAEIEQLITLPNRSSGRWCVDAYIPLYRDGVHRVLLGRYDSSWEHSVSR